MAILLSSRARWAPTQRWMPWPKLSARCWRRSIRNVSVAAMTKNLADELGPQGINVTCVHPGLTRTERTTDEAAAGFNRNSIGRIVEADEVAYLVAFLASPKSAAITGDSIACGGGARGPIYY